VLTLPVDHPTVTAQRTVYAVIDTNLAAFGVYADRPQSARIALANIKSIARRVLSFPRRDELADHVPAELLAAYLDHRPQPAYYPGLRPDQRGVPAPELVAAAAVGITSALNILNVSQQSAAANAMRWLLSKPNGHVAGSSVVWSVNISDTLTAIQIKAHAPLINPGDQLRFRTTAAVPKPPRTVPSRVARISGRLPSTLWPTWSMRFRLPRTYHHHLRPALSCAVLLCGTRLSLTDVAQELGSVVTGDVVRSMLQRLNVDAHWQDVSLALDRLSEYLGSHSAPIDYRRRRALDYSDLLPDSVWGIICRDTGTLPGVGQKADVARCTLFASISGMPAQFAPMAGRYCHSRAFTTRLSDFPLLLTPPLAARLRSEGEQFLAEHHIDEPLTWHPPLQLLKDLELPGPDLGRIDIDALHQLANQVDLTVGDIARKLATSLDTVRYLLDEHPVELEASPTRSGSKRALAMTAVRTVVTAEKLSELYFAQGLSIREIAKRLGTNEKTVMRIARSHNIVLRPKRVLVKRDWLYEQYVIQQRTLPEIGSMIGIDRNTVAKWVKRHNLHDRPPVTRPNVPPLSANAARELLRPALERRGGWQRLKCFTIAVEFPSLAAASKAIGTTSSALGQRISVLEQDLCGQLLVRSRHQLVPMSLTPLGANVAEAFRLRWAEAMV
jgi:Bacterial regulatory helix-turn-helix protein, lysR family